MLQNTAQNIYKLPFQLLMYISTRQLQSQYSILKFKRTNRFKQYPEFLRNDLFSNQR